MSITKTCNRCFSTKNITEFYKNRQGKDGYFNRCKKCHDFINKKNVLKYQKKPQPRSATITPEQFLQRAWGAISNGRHCYRKRGIKTSLTKEEFFLLQKIPPSLACLIIGINTVDHFI